MREGDLEDEELEKLYHIVEKIGEENSFLHNNLLLTFGQKTLGLNEEEIAEFDAETNEYIESLNALKTSFCEEENVSLRLRSWEVDFAIKSYQQIKYLNIYLGCHRIITAPYQPIVFSEQCAVRKS